MTMESWAVAAPQTIELDGVTALDVRLQAGRGEVVVSPTATSTRIEVIEVGGRPLQILRDGGRLRVGYEHSGVEGLFARFKSITENDRAVVRVTVPTGTAVDIATVGARADVSGSAHTVVKTVTGSVQLEGTSGPLSVKTVSGDATVVGHAGDVNAATVSGVLRLDGPLGRVTAQSVSGEVAVTVRETAPLVTVRTVSGTIRVRLDAATPLNLKVRGATAQAMLDGAVLASTSQRTLSVDHVEPGATGRAAAYVSATTGTGQVSVTRG